MDELNEGKMLYAAIKVMNPNTNLPKIVFINWVHYNLLTNCTGCIHNL